MQRVTINKSQNISFTSRNKTIRFANQIARISNSWVPRVSSTKYEGLNAAKKYENLILSMEADICNLRLYQKLRATFIGNNFIKNIKNVVEPIKRFKIGNCGEAADLTSIVARVNGLNNISIASLKTPNGSSYDHAVLLVNEKKPYIIDGWLGFADYIPKAIERYQKEFRNHFDFNKLNTEKIVIVPYQGTNFFNGFLNRPFTKQEIEDVKKLYPEIIIKKNNLYL